jgi:hypothetical protein
MSDREPLRDAAGPQAPSHAAPGSVQVPDDTIDALREEVEAYGDELLEETRRTARRLRAHDASSDHVRTAGDRLVNVGETGSTTYLYALGAAAFGAGLSGVVAMVLAGSYPALGVILCVVLLVTGAMSLGYQVGRR